MPSNENRILTTHIGSFPRPPELVDLFERVQEGYEVDHEQLQNRIAEATQNAVQRQLDAGIDIINNGEQPRIGFNFYVANRLTGYQGETQAEFWADLQDYPSYAEQAFDTVEMDLQARPAATAAGVLTIIPWTHL